MLFGNELANHLIKERERIKALMSDRNERIARGETDEDDCFISIKVETDSLHEIAMQLKILEGDGMWDVDIVVDQEGLDVGARWVNTKYGPKLVARGIWASSIKALCKKTGWTVKTIRWPCWTKFYPGSGGGMCGVFTGRTGYSTWHTNMATGDNWGFPKSHL